MSRRRVTDPSALRALSHPLRLDLLELLVLHGAHTASEAAAVLGQTPANCSWHLRKLAEHGFVRGAPGGAGRSRPWRAVTEGLTWGDPDDDEPTTAAGDALTDMLLEREVHRLRAARAASPQEEKSWQTATSFSQSRLWLTAQEATDVSAAMVELFSSYGERAENPEQRPADARLVALVGWLVPNGPAAGGT